MITKNFKLRENQIKQLEEHYKATGTRMSETVRRAIDLYFIKVDENEKRDAKPNNK
jgi:hypothetical protein